MLSAYQKEPGYDGPELWLGGGFGVGLMIAAIGIAAVIACSSPARSQDTIHLEGPIDCGLWIEGRTARTSDVFEGYVIGMLNGLAFGAWREFWEAGGTPVSRPAVFLWLDNYCRDNPLRGLSVGIIDLFRERAGR